ncbi:MAG: MBL fold metallo-hydrolase [Lachnospiraceae bacterium]|nr:MBL fold metallo-hydrolase [Lachnospiraceae bacterium]
MKIVNLIENTEGTSGCAYAHGLSFYVETKKHKLLLDLGPSEETLRNAEHLGIDLTQVDTVILSHGHYDHSGGILPFTQINPHATIYMQRTATAEYYADDGDQAPERYRYIGIDPKIAELPQVSFVDGDLEIDEELSLFTVHERTHALPFTNKRLLVRKDGGYERDDFIHEHYLVIHEDGKSVLMSGCAHNGILSILDAYAARYGADPTVVISGFHLMKKTDYREDQILEIRDIAQQLKGYKTSFITCHCTGVPAYEIMKEIMGPQLSYAHSGDEIKLRFLNPPMKKGGTSYMKWHKFFAWAAVFCFVMTMVTGYKRK